MTGKRTGNKPLRLADKYTPEIPEKKSPKIAPLTQKEIDVLNSRNNEKIIFSFNFLDIEHELFNLGIGPSRSVSICGEWFITLLSSLKEVSNLTSNELRSQRQHYDFHNHDWDERPTKFNFDEDFLEQVNGVQFRLTASKGRVHGFMIGNRFYVVWLDPHHNLYPDEKHGGTKYYQKPETCFEKLNNELIRLRKENTQLMELLDDQTK